MNTFLIGLNLTGQNAMIVGGGELGSIHSQDHREADRRRAHCKARNPCFGFERGGKIGVTDTSPHVKTYNSIGRSWRKHRTYWPNSSRPRCTPFEPVATLFGKSPPIITPERQGMRFKTRASMRKSCGNGQRCIRNFPSCCKNSSSLSAAHRRTEQRSRSTTSAWF